MKNNKKGKTAGSASKETKGVSDKQLDNLLSSLQEKFGEGSIMRLGEVSKVDVAVIPTGSFSLDLASGRRRLTARAGLSRSLDRNRAAKQR